MSIKNNSAIFSLLKTHWILVGIILLATFLRVHDLNTKAIFFGDAARDLWAAKTAVDTKQPPLLGIASSVPRFRQGPVAVWISMIVYLFADDHFLPFALTFAAIGIAAVIALYELAVTQVNKSTALLASFILAASPLAVAHSRMPYHITPIPLMMVMYLFSLTQLKKNPSLQSWFWAGLAWAGLFQFELATLPLLGLIPYLWWRMHTKNWKPLIVSGFGSAVGLVPQILHDLTHGFTQLGGFSVWVVYRVAVQFGLWESQANVSLWEKLATPVQTLAVFGTRIVSVDQPLIGLTWLLISIVGIGWTYRRFRRKQLSFLEEINTLAIFILVVAFLVQGAPSEAYFPPFLVCLPLFWAGVFSSIQARWARFILPGLILWGVVTVVAISQANFFVSVPNRSFQYGPGVGEQRQLLNTLQMAGVTKVHLRTTEPGGIFPNYFLNITWLAQKSALEFTTEQKAGYTTFFVEPHTTTLLNYPSATLYWLPSTVLVQIPGL